MTSTQQKVQWAARLKTARKAANVSQERAAAQVGTSRRHWIRWESGATMPNPAYLDRIAEVLGDATLAAEAEDDEEAAEPVPPVTFGLLMEAMFNEAVARAAQKLVAGQEVA